MELIVAVGIPLLIVGACAWLRFQPSFQFRPIPLGALLVLLTGSVFGHEFFNIPSGPIPLTLDRLLIAGTMALFAWRWVLGREDIRRLNTLDYILLGLITLASISTLTHNWRILENMPLSRLLFFYMMPVALYWLVRTSRLEAADLKLISIILGMFGIYLALTAIAEVKNFPQFVFPGYILNSDFREFLGRGRGPFLNPVSNGIFQTICFCCVLMWWPRTNGWGKGALVLAAIVIAIGIYATLTRSVWVGLIAACGLFIWLPARRPVKGTMVIVATLTIILFFPVISKKIVSFKRDKEVSQAEMEQSAQMRPLFAIVAWNMFKDQPVLGVGFGQYSKAKYPYLRDPYSGKPLTVTRGLMQHNVFLAYVTETGLIGLATLLAMLIQMARISWKTWNNSDLDLWARQFGLLSLVVLAAYSLNGLFHDVSIIPQQHMLMFFLLGLVNNIYSRQSTFTMIEPATDLARAETITQQAA